VDEMATIKLSLPLPESETRPLIPHPIAMNVNTLLR
jgi:hypothetical protein